MLSERAVTAVFFRFDFPFMQFSLIFSFFISLFTAFAGNGEITVFNTEYPWRVAVFAIGKSVFAQVFVGL